MEERVEEVFLSIHGLDFYEPAVTVSVRRVDGNYISAHPSPRSDYWHTCVTVERRED